VSLTCPPAAIVPDAVVARPVPRRETMTVPPFAPQALDAGLLL